MTLGSGGVAQRLWVRGYLNNVITEGMLKITGWYDI